MKDELVKVRNDEVSQLFGEVQALRVERAQERREYLEMVDRMRQDKDEQLAQKEGM
eukprot:COSAG05_NODE_17963_length_316_cov_0.857143_1_plen_55_part_10